MHRRGLHRGALVDHRHEFGECRRNHPAGQRSQARTDRWQVGRAGCQKIVISILTNNGKGLQRTAGIVGVEPTAQVGVHRTKLRARFGHGIDADFHGHLVRLGRAVDHRR